MGICHSTNSEKKMNLKSKENYIPKQQRDKKLGPSSQKRIFDKIENNKCIFLYYLLSHIKNIGDDNFEPQHKNIDIFQTNK